MSKLLLYCVKAKPYLYRQDDDTFKLENKIVDEDISDYKKYYGLNNGKIVAECDFEVEKIRKGWGCLNGTRYFRNNMNHYYPDYELEKQSCLSFDEIDKYLKGPLNENCGYAIHINNLHIFDEHRNIRDYFNIEARTMQEYMNQRALVKAPQNMCNAYDVYKNHYIIISIRPQWLYKILNGEKTIEVRKKVLKEMLE